MFLECFTGSLRINKPFYYKNHLGTYHEMHLFVRTKLFPLYVLLAIKLSFSKLLIKYLSTKKANLIQKIADTFNAFFSNEFGWQIRN